MSFSEFFACLNCADQHKCGDGVIPAPDARECAAEAERGSQTRRTDDDALKVFLGSERVHVCHTRFPERPRLSHTQPSKTKSKIDLISRYTYRTSRNIL